MKRYGNLWDKIWTMDNLKKAHRMARKDKKLYREVQMVDSNPEYYLGKIRDMMLNGEYQIKPEDYTVTVIRDKTKQREIFKLKYYPHRIIQWAILLIVEHIFYKTFCPFVCASVKGRGGMQVMKLMKKYLKDREGTQYCLKIDIRKYYPSINHTILKNLLRKKFKDKKLLALFDMIIDSYPGEVGLPIGSYLSQFLANYYLAFFDHWLKEELGCKYVIRYMDDIVILGESKEMLWNVFGRMKYYLEHVLDLHIKDNRQIFPTGIRGVDYVGYRYFYGFILLRKQTCKRLKNKTIEIFNKVKLGSIVTENDFFSVNSYLGRIIHCNHFRLKFKYFSPILPYISQYKIIY